MKYYEVAYGDPKEVESQARIDHAFKLVDPKNGCTEEEDVHLWLLGDLNASNLIKPFAESLKAWAETYANEHSIFGEKDYRPDPGYISLHQLAYHLPARLRTNKRCTPLLVVPRS